MIEYKQSPMVIPLLQRIFVKKCLMLDWKKSHSHFMDIMNDFTTI